MTEKLYSYLINYCHIIAVAISSSLLLLACRHHCWRLSFGPSLSKSSSAASRRRLCYIVVGSVVPYCGWLCQLMRFIVGGVLLLFLLAASTQSKVIYPFVPKFQQVIGTNWYSTILFEAGAWLMKPVYVCIFQPTGWEIYFPLLS